MPLKFRGDVRRVSCDTGGIQEHRYGWLLDGTFPKLKHCVSFLCEIGEMKASADIIIHALETAAPVDKH